ncbi:hypothetical protein EC968_004155 [Mortierella alpina]|nr:hypothetical protein EC968_004155 [Mortierella alpina]
MPETAIAIDTSHSSLEKDSKVVPGSHDLPSTASTANLSVSGTESHPSADDNKTASIDTVTDSISKLSVSPSPPVSTPQAEPLATAENKKDPSASSSSSSSSSSETARTSAAAKVQEQAAEAEELSPEEAKLRAKGLKSTHRPGFYVHIDSPRRLRIQTSTATFDLDRYCPHANADMLKWGVLRSDMTLRCGVHYWGFDLSKGGQCIAHPEESLNACPVSSSELEW